MFVYISRRCTLFVYCLPPLFCVRAFRFCLRFSGVSRRSLRYVYFAHTLYVCRLRTTAFHVFTADFSLPLDLLLCDFDVGWYCGDFYVDFVVCGPLLPLLLLRSTYVVDYILRCDFTILRFAILLPFGASATVTLLILGCCLPLLILFIWRFRFHSAVCVSAYRYVQPLPVRYVVTDCSCIWCDTFGCLVCTVYLVDLCLFSPAVTRLPPLSCVYYRTFAFVCFG